MRNFYSKIQKKHIICALVIIFICLIISLVPKYTIQYENNMEHDGNVGELFGESWIEQKVQIEDAHNLVGVRVGTYQRKLEKGRIVLELYNKNKKLASKVFAAKKIKDNQILWLPYSQINEGEYILKIHVEGFEQGVAPTIFTNCEYKCLKDGEIIDEGIVYYLGRKSNNCNVNFIVVLLGLLGLLVLGLGIKFTDLVRIPRISIMVLGGSLIIGVVSVCFTSLILVGQINPKILYSICNNTLNGKYYEQKDFRIDEICNYRYDNTVYAQNINIWLENINSEVNSISIEYTKETPFKRIDTLVFSKNGDKIRKVDNYEIINKGKIVTIYMDVGTCESLRLDYVNESTFDDLKDVKLYIKSVKINDEKVKDNVRDSFIKTFVMIFLFIVLLILTICLIIKFGMGIKCVQIVAEKNISPESLFVCFGLIMGLIFIVLLPITQAPDEGAHLKFICQELGYTSENLGGAVYSEFDGGLDGVATNAGKHVEKSKYLQGFTKNNLIVKKRPYNVNYKILRHLPQAIGVQLTIWLHKGSACAYLIGRICGLLFYIGIGVISIKIIPYKKYLLATILLIPQMIQQAASLSYDCTLLASSILLISYVLAIREEKRKCGFKEYICLVALLIPIAIIKINYCVLCLIVLLIPSHIDFMTKKKKICAGVGLCLIMGAVFALTKINLGRQLLAFIIAPIKSAKLILRTIKIDRIFWGKSMIGAFGWLDSYLPLWIILSIYCFIILMSIWECKEIEKKIVFNKMEVGICLMVFLGGAISCLVGMLTWSMLFYAFPISSSINDYINVITKVPQIRGVQGRYFLELILLPLIPIPVLKRVDKKYINSIIVVFEVVICVSVGYTLIKRYWG